MKSFLKILLLLLLAIAAHAQQLKKVNTLLTWKLPPTYHTNFGVYNIRILSQGSATNNYLTWPVLSVVTNVTSHLLYNHWENQLFSVSHTNVETGVESQNDISPVTSQSFAITNLSADPVDVGPNPFPDDITPEEQAEVKQSLQIWWNGPTNWQGAGKFFNVRTAINGSLPTNYATWPVLARITNILNTKFFNVNPTQFFAITLTNAVLGTETTEGIPPIRAQYNWQGLTNMVTSESEETTGDDSSDVPDDLRAILSGNETTL